MRNPTSDPRTVATDARAAESKPGQADTSKGTATVCHEHVTAALASAAMRGCTCSPTVAELVAGRLTYLQVVHGCGCPAIAEEVVA